MGKSFDRPTPEQLDEMKALLDEAMQRRGLRPVHDADDAARRSLATTDDLVDLCRVVAQARRHLLVAHPQRGDRRRSTAVKEAIAIGERAGVPVDIIHLKIADQKHWGRMNEVVALIEAGPRAGA